MQNEHEMLASRIRAALADEPTIREVRMFGAMCFMVEDRIVVAAQRGGGLLVRIDPARNGELTARTGATPARMGPGRTMGPGWINVPPEAIETEQELSFCIGVAMDHNASTARARGDRGA